LLDELHRQGKLHRGDRLVPAGVGARRSLPGGGISLHSRSVEFEHPVRHEPVAVTAPVPADDNLWAYFENR